MCKEAKDPGRREFLGTLAAASALALVPSRLRALAAPLGGDIAAPWAPRAAATTFRMAAIGDSIMWGQGLLPQQKFAMKVQKWLEGELPRPVEMQFFARSGAGIRHPDIGADNSAPFPADVPVYYWEMPGDFPTITTQALRVQSPETIDLLLLDGGANDFGFLRTAYLDMTPARIRAETKQLVGDRMRGLLDVVMPRFPRARVVVTGYYRAVSPQSAPVALLDVLRAMAAGIPEMKVQLDQFDISLVPSPQTAQCLGSVARSLLIDNSAAFAEASSDQLARAVADASAKYGRRVHFAPVSFADENAVGASTPYIFDARPGSTDPAKPQRVLLCQQNPKFSGWMCENASLFHPNPAGADAYAAAIKVTLAPYLEQWRATAAPLAQATPLTRTRTLTPPPGGTRLPSQP